MNQNRQVKKKAPFSSLFFVRGFSLLELLVVMGIMIILLGITVPAIAPLLRASNMNTAAALIADEFSFARQTALTRNRDVEIRFYQLGSPNNPDKKEYRAFRSLLANGNDPSNSEPLTPVKYLPDTVIISSDEKFSTLLDYDNPGRSGLDDGSETLPSMSGPASYISFLFRATGGTSLSPVTPPDGNWFLTLYQENTPLNTATGIPDNYVNIQLDPVTGRARTYRP